MKGQVRTCSLCGGLFLESVLRYIGLAAVNSKPVFLCDACRYQIKAWDEVDHMFDTEENTKEDDNGKEA